MIPVYGFVEGDSLGLLILVREHETIGELAERIQRSAGLRVARRDRVHLVHAGEPLDPMLRVRQTQIEPLDRIDLVEARSDAVR